MVLKDILNNVLEQSGFLSRNSYTGSVDPDDKQMVAIANRVAYELLNYYKWGEIRADFTVNIQEGQTAYLLPVDYQEMIPDSAWELDGNRPVEFPVPDRRWFVYKFTNWSDGGRIRMRRYGNELQIQDPVAGEGFQFEYISKWAIKAEDGTRKEFFTEDSDSWDLDDQLLILGVQAHWMQTKLMPQYKEHFANYRSKTGEAIGRSAGSSTIGGLNNGDVGNDAPYYPLYRPAS